MSHLPENGFENGPAADPALRHRPVALVLLIAALALALSTFIAATAVSIGFARADVAGASPLELPLGAASAN
jgi:hypothetical protein